MSGVSFASLDIFGSISKIEWDGAGDYVAVEINEVGVPFAFFRFVERAGRRASLDGVLSFPADMQSKGKSAKCPRRTRIKHFLG
jgi:hypothetical protein